MVTSSSDCITSEAVDLTLAEVTPATPEVLVTTGSVVVVAADAIYVWLFPVAPTPQFVLILESEEVTHHLDAQLSHVRFSILYYAE
jgi:hypothetical protein